MSLERQGETADVRQGMFFCPDLASKNQGKSKKAQEAPFCVAVIVGRGAALTWQSLTMTTSFNIRPE